MGIVILFLIILIFYDIIKDRCYSFFNTSLVKSVDGNSYPVVSTYADQQEAADLIAGINSFTVEVIKKLKTTYLTKSPTTPDQIKGFEMASILENRYSPASLMENQPTTAKDTSYTQNKGEVISLCLREKQSGQNKFHSIDVLKFVMLHELAHIVTPEIDHSDWYWTNFRFLLEFCNIHGLYTSPNYGVHNVPYCGMTIRYNPIYDDMRTISYFYGTAR